MSPEDIGDLISRPALSTEQAARMLGVSANTLRRSIEDGSCPVPYVRIGERSLRWPTSPILALLGIDRDTGPEPTP